MNREEKRAYLSRYIELEREVDLLIEKNDFWVETAYSTSTTNLDNLGITGNTKKIPIEEHLDICITIQNKIEEANKILQEILTAIDTVENSTQRSALRYRYISGMTLFEIAKEMKYSMDHVKWLLRSGVDNLTLFPT